MAAVSRLLSSPSPARTASAILVCACVLAGALFGVPSSASAQGYGWFGGLFGGGQPQGQAPQYPGYGTGRPPRSYYAPPRRHAQKHQTRQDSEGGAAETTPFAQPKPDPKPAATVFVDVFGDTLGQQLAGGLEDALSDKADVGVVNAARGPSGLANDGYYDWPKAIGDLLAQHTAPDRAASAAALAKAKGANPGEANPPRRDRIDVAVMMVGTNDRQLIVKDGQKLKPGSDAWIAAYRARAMSIAEAFERRKIPLIWVGVPIVKNDDFADDMAALNDIYREVAARTGASYIDTWEAFSDDDGDFAAFGPDINGQTVRLRSADGVYFTKAGARKLAHFVEGQVRRDLEGKTPLPQLPTADISSGDAKPPSRGEGPSASAPVKPEAGPIKNLSEPPAARDGRLAETPMFAHGPARDGPARDGPARDEPELDRLVKGEAAPPPPGRADNFRWPPPAAPASGIAP